MAKVPMPDNDNEPKGFVVVITNWSGVESLIGTKTGRLFRTEEAADQIARRIVKHRPNLNAFAMPFQGHYLNEE